MYRLEEVLDRVISRFFERTAGQPKKVKRRLVASCFSEKC